MNPWLYYRPDQYTWTPTWSWWHGETRDHRFVIFLRGKDSNSTGILQIWGISIHLFFAVWVYRENSLYFMHKFLFSIWLPWKISSHALNSDSIMNNEKNNDEYWIITKKKILGETSWGRCAGHLRDQASCIVAISYFICNYFLFELKLSTVFNKIKGSEQFRNTLLKLLI